MRYQVRMGTRSGALGCACSLFFLSLSGCSGGADEEVASSIPLPAARGCQRDTDCKGNRVCTKGECQEPAQAASTTLSTATPPPSNRPSDSAGLSATSVPSCLPCSSQEDFDRVMKAGSKCCPVNACSGDSDCSSGRVCCKIPSGRLCADAARCTGPNRVQGMSRTERDAACRRTCPGQPVENTHCYCVCMGDCPGP